MGFRIAVTSRNDDLGWRAARAYAAHRWYHACLHETRPDAAGLVERYGPDLEVREWGARLRCSKCGSHDCDFVVCGYSPPNE